MSEQRAIDVFQAMKFGTVMCVVCRVNFPSYGKVRVDDMFVGYCRPCVVGYARLAGMAASDKAEVSLRRLIKEDRMEIEPFIQKLREAQRKIREKSERNS